MGAHGRAPVTIEIQFFAGDEAMTMLRTTGALLCGAWLCVGCAGGQTSPDTAEAEPEPWQAVEQDPSDLAEPSAASDDSASSSQDTETADASGDGVTPEFRPGMSVNEATNAVPPNVERLNIEQERLAEPLMDPKLYEPCSLQGHHHFTVKVAVWDGKAVGLDVSTKPNDEKLAACLRQQIQDVEWEDKAKSLNTVEYSY